MPSAAVVARQMAARRRRYGRKGWLGIATEPLPVTFPSSPLTTKVWIALSADLSASRYTWNWLDITEHVRHDLGISLDVGRREASSRVNASRCQMKLANPAGIFSRRNPMGPYYGLLGGKTANVPIWIELDPGDGYRTMYEGYINDLPTRWTDPSGTDSYVVIQCAGILRRLEQGENLKSPMFRSFSGLTDDPTIQGDPVAYWALEDGSSATQAGSAVSGVPPMTVMSGTVSFAGASDLVGSSPVALLSAGVQLVGTVPTHAATGGWVARFAMRVESEPAAAVTILELSTPSGTVPLWRLRLTPGSPGFVDMIGVDSGGVETVYSFLTIASPGGPTEADFYGSWWIYSLTTVQFGADVEAGLTVGDADDFYEPPAGIETASTHGNITQVRIMGDTGISIGHFGVYNNVEDIDQGVFGAEAVTPAIAGWSGEQAHVRMARLCREEGIPFVCQAAASAAMGPQSSDTLLEVLRECEKADGGVLFEQGYGLGYQALSERYNQPVALNLDFDQRHIYGTPEPADDDQRFRNQWTIRRDGGSSATYRDPDYSAADGLHDDGDTVSVDTDAQTFFHAGHRVHRDSVDEDRWPRLAINLAGTPDLIPGWLSTPLGSRVNVANPPPEMTPATIDAVIEGYTQRWDTVSWVASMNTSPASIYQVGVAGDATTDGSWAQTSDAELAEDLDTTETSIEVTSTDTWTTTPAGELIVFGGEVVSLDAVSGSAPNWTFTVMRSVNGVIKSHSTASPAHLRAVRVYRPAVAVY